MIDLDIADLIKAGIAFARSSYCAGQDLENTGFFNRKVCYVEIKERVLQKHNDDLARELQRNLIEAQERLAREEWYYKYPDYWDNPTPQPRPQHTTFWEDSPVDNHLALYTLDMFEHILPEEGISLLEYDMMVV